MMSQGRICHGWNDNAASLFSVQSSGSISAKFLRGRPTWLRPTARALAHAQTGTIRRRMSEQWGHLRRRSMLTLGGVLAVYTVSVATHQGEFWPFSIFPMFSRAGRPWRRALMVELSPDEDSASSATPLDWGPWSLQALPGKPLPTREVGVNTNDLSKFVQLTRVWNEERLSALRALYEAPLASGRRLMLLSADGRSSDNGGVEIGLTGLVRMSQESSRINPALKKAHSDA